MAPERGHAEARPRGERTEVRLLPAASCSVCCRAGCLARSSALLELGGCCSPARVVQPPIFSGARPPGWWCGHFSLPRTAALGQASTLTTRNPQPASLNMDSSQLAMHRCTLAKRAARGQARRRYSGTLQPRPTFGFPARALSVLKASPVAYGSPVSGSVYRARCPVTAHNFGTFSPVDTLPLSVRTSGMRSTCKTLCQHLHSPL
jgi:hypothetical protein